MEKGVERKKTELVNVGLHTCQILSLHGADPIILGGKKSINSFRTSMQLSVLE